MRARRHIAILALALAGMLILAVFAFPAGAAVICPACYGLERLDAGTFVERSMATQQRARVAAVLREARQQVRGFFGSVESDPHVLVCASEDCYRRLGGGRTRGRSYFDFVLILSPRGTDSVIAAHELTHIELHRRLGFIRFVSGAIPAWFDEGLAVTVSGDPRYLGPVSGADRCLVKSDETLPSGLSEWNRRAGEDEQLYAKAACRVSAWIAREGGAPAVTQLASRVSAGTPFAQAYGERP